MSESLESVVAKIQKLGAMAAGGTEHEAANAASLMQALLAKHNLDMATIEASAPVKAGPMARVKQMSDAAAMYRFQQELMQSVASNNFCKAFITEKVVPHERKKGEFRKVKRFSLLGSKVNVAVALHMYDYLTGTLDRLLPYTGMEKRGKNALLWLDGATDRLSTRLWRKRMDMMAEAKQQADERKARQAHPSAAPEGNALTLLDVYYSEEDLNTDHMMGYELGTTTRRRLEREAKAAAKTAVQLAEEEAKWERYIAEQKAQEAAERAAETPTQRAKREAREAREEAKRKEKDDRAYAKFAARRNTSAYQAGSRTASEIGLDTQVGHTKQESIG